MGADHKWERCKTSMFENILQKSLLGAPVKERSRRRTIPCMVQRQSNHITIELHYVS